MPKNRIKYCSPDDQRRDPLSTIFQQWPCIILLVLIMRFPIEHVMLRDKDNIKEQADIAQAEFRWIPRDARPVSLKTGIYEELRKR